MAISVVGVGAWSSGVTTGAPNAPYPAVTINAGDLLVYALNVHKAAAQTEDVDSQASGWTLQGKQTGNTEATATDAGPCLIAVFTRLAAGGESGGTSGQMVITGSTSGSSGTCAAGRIFVLRRTAGDSWDVAVALGADDTTGTSWLVTYGSNPGIAAGDHLVFGNALPTDTNPTYGSESFTASGATIAAATDESDLSVTAGVDGGGKSGARAVTAGTATAAPVWTATLSGTTTHASGPAFVLRAREGTSAVTGVADAPLGGLTAAASGHHIVSGAATASLGAVTATAQGEATSPTVVGVAQANLGALTATASGTRTVSGVAGGPLAGLSATVQGARTVPGVAAGALGALTGTAAGLRSTAATATADLGALSATAAGARTVAGTASASLAGLAATADGDRTVSAVASAPLGDLTATLSGGTGSSADLPGAGTLTAAASVAHPTASVLTADAGLVGAPLATRASPAPLSVGAVLTTDAATAAAATVSTSAAGVLAAAATVTRRPLVKVRLTAATGRPRHHADVNARPTLTAGRFRP